MNDQNYPAQSSNSPASSYVDEYVPQANSGMPTQPIKPSQQSQTPQTSQTSQPSQATSPAPSPWNKQPAHSMPTDSATPFSSSNNPFVRSQPQTTSSTPTPAAPMARTSPTPAMPTDDLLAEADESQSDRATTGDTDANPSGVSQSLEDQNIFELLGVANVSDEEKESFLDELQQVIWEDFLENDAELLLTTEEMSSLKTLMGDRPKNDLQLQEEVITYLEKFIPDLEEVMLEKALELKEDMVRERLAGLREYFADQSDKQSQLDEAESLMTKGQWRATADVMNRLQA